MSDAKAFETALTANPDDTAGWCAYADYLVEQGDTRGEFMQAELHEQVYLHEGDFE
jgi:uncharacterized protein (TIGR02996 family)